MPSIPQTRKLLLLAVCLTLSGLPQLRGQDKSERVNFDTADGVKLEGTYYPSTKKQKAPTVILLHDFDATGKIRTDGWDSLATKLQEKGFAVLAFDFRGFGQSTAVSDSFWNPMKSRHNMVVRGFTRNSQLMAMGKQPSKTISSKDFPASYYAYLVNDISAAKAFIDNQNDGGDLNSRNVVVIGAGQGATLGLMWMATEYKRHKALVKENAFGGPPILVKLDDETGGNDLMAGVFLSISPTLGGHQVPIHRWLTEVGKKNKLPLAFVYGKDETGADARALNYLKTIDPGFERGKGPKEKDLALTGEKAVPGTKLSGSKLLQNTLETEDFIVNKYLGPVAEKHRFVQWKMRNNDDNYFYWKNALGPATLAKIKGDHVTIIMPLSVADIQR
jgi:pimeloyl-ACP methyl ester carboxylesterase